MPAAKQWKGLISNAWTVIEEREKGSKKVLCRCECGTERLVLCGSIRTGKSLSCGCRRKSRPAQWPKRIAKAGPDDCWEFQGARNRCGYGVAGVGLVHRAVYERDVGPIPNGQCVMHTCDNPACCNPTHLKLGSHAENMEDMKAKGRAKNIKGAQHPNAKLSEADVRAIREAYPDMTQDHLAKKYGVTQRVIGLVVRGISYRSVK
jgi:hypothetical protein